jgi:hypothetical protein
VPSLRRDFYTPWADLAATFSYHGRWRRDSLAAEPVGIEARSSWAVIWPQQLFVFTQFPRESAMRFLRENRFTLFLELLYCTS